MIINRFIDVIKRKKKSNKNTPNNIFNRCTVISNIYHRVISYQDIQKWNYYDEILLKLPILFIPVQISLKYKSTVNISNNKDSIKFFKIFKSETNKNMYIYIENNRREDSVSVSFPTIQNILSYCCIYLLLLSSLFFEPRTTSRKENAKISGLTRSRAW